MNLFNGRLAKPITAWCCERGQRDGVEVCVECRQSLLDWAEVRLGECQLAKDYGFNPQEHQCSGECPDEGCPHYGTPHSHPDTFNEQYQLDPHKNEREAYDRSMNEFFYPDGSPRPEDIPASVFTAEQLDKLATANALDEHLGIRR